MTELSDQQEEEVRRVLNSINIADVEGAAFDRKYDESWYEEQLAVIEEVEQYFVDFQQALARSEMSCPKDEEAAEEALMAIRRIHGSFEHSLEVHKSDGPYVPQIENFK